MTKPTFSIIIPAYNRRDTIRRCLNSVIGQTYDPDFYEIILVDDGSTDDTFDLAEHLLDQKEFMGNSQLIPLNENRGRIGARNVGMAAAQGDWICWLDSDDEYLSTYLEVYARAIQENPDTEIFTSGTVVYDEKDVFTRLRDPFLPGVRPDGRGCDTFKSGGVSTGGFVFKTRFAREVGFLPEARTPYGDNSSLPALATQKWPELGALYGQNEAGQWLPFGNPWGDDWLMFFLITRNNLVKKINYYPYLQHVRHG